MVETFTPAGCGGRRRQAAAVLLFSVGAIGAAAGLGAILGASGSSLPTAWAVGVAMSLAVLGALREAGVLRIPLPDLRRQVPEPWRREKPLAVWSTGYGLILGSGFGTFQPVATFWVVCAGAIALGRPLVAALCLAPFGLGRALMAAFPGDDPLRRLAGAHRGLRPVNAAVLAAAALLLLPSMSSGAPSALSTGQRDPSVSRNVIAYTDASDGATNVVVLARGAPPVVFPGGRLPSLNGDVLAYVDDAGIRVVLWRTGQEVGRVTGQVDKPALSGPRLAYVETIGARKRLLVRNRTTNVVRIIARVGPAVDLGRPALMGQLIAWHESAGNSNHVFLRSLTGGRARIIAGGSRSALHANPALSPGYIAWVESRAERSSVLMRRLPNGAVRHVASTRGPTFHYWNTTIEAGRVWVTRWGLGSNRSRVLAYRWAR
jgi:hypothetical protein